MNFSKHSNPRLSKATESFQTNFNLCLVSFDCAIKGRLGRGREPTTSPRERSGGIEEMSRQWCHIRLLRSADQNVWMVPLAGSCFRILDLTGRSRFSIAPTRALLLNTSLNNDEFSLWKCSERPALPQKIGNQQILRFLASWRWFRDHVLLLDVAGLCRMDARDVSSRWISACWISTSQCWLWSSPAGRRPQMINHFMKTIVPSIDEQWQTTPTKINKVDMKNRKKTWNRGRIAADWQTSASLSATRAMPRFPSRTSAPRPIQSLGGVPSSALAACCGLLWSCLPLPFGGTIYDGQGTVGRDHISGRNSYCVIFVVNGWQIWSGCSQVASDSPHLLATYKYAL